MLMTHRHKERRDNSRVITLASQPSLLQTPGHTPLPSSPPLCQSTSHPFSKQLRSSSLPLHLLLTPPPCTSACSSPLSVLTSSLLQSFILLSSLPLFSFLHHPPLFTSPSPPSLPTPFLASSLLFLLSLLLLLPLSDSCYPFRAPMTEGMTENRRGEGLVNSVGHWSSLATEKDIPTRTMKNLEEHLTVLKLLLLPW